MATTASFYKQRINDFDMKRPIHSFAVQLMACHPFHGGKVAFGNGILPLFVAWPGVNPFLGKAPLVTVLCGCFLAMI